jgi:hypothetical protein
MVAGALPPVAAAGVLAVALAWVPGRALVAWLAPPTHGDRRLVISLALALSPFAAGAPAALLALLGVAPLVAARAVLIAWAIALACAPGRATDVDLRPQTWIVAAAWTALIALLLATNPSLLSRADGWFHAAVTLQVAQRGLPPEDPFFAGLRLLYFWGTHAWAAMWLVLAPRIPVWAPLATLQIAAACACPLAVGVLAGRLGATRGVQRVAMSLALAGLAPFAWLLIPGRILIGGVQGGAEVTQLLERGLWPVLAAMDPGTLHASVLFPGDKFLIATPFALGMALAVLSVCAVLALIEVPGPRAALTLAVIQAAALWLHAVVGAAIVVAVVGWWFLSLAPAVRQLGLRRALMLAPPALALAGIVMFPYLRGITAGKTQSIGWGLDAATLRTFLLAGAVLVPAGLAWLGRAARDSHAAAATACMTFALATAALLAGLPLGNQSKLFSLLFMMLAAPAALGWAALAARLRVPGRRVLIATLVFALAPTQLLALWGAATERGQIHLAWDRPVSSAERDGMRWAARHTPADAVFVDGSGSLDFTVVAGRSAVWGGEAWAGNWGYPAAALAARRRAAETLGQGSEPPADVAAMLHGLERPVIVVARRSADDTGAWQRLVAAPDSGSAHVRLLYRNPDLALFAWGEFARGVS